MIRIVEAHADELTNVSYARTKAYLAFDDGQAVQVELRELLQSLRGQSRACDVRDMRGQVAHAPFCVQYPGFFLTGRAKAYKFHLSSLL
jgi:hypothetical protein